FIRTRKLACGWNVEHRIPVHARVVLRRRCGVRRGLCHQVDGLARDDVLLVGIDESVTSGPDLVFGCRQLRDNELAGITGDDHFGEFGRKTGSLCDDPDACLRPVRSGDLAADRVGPDGSGSLLLRVSRASASHHKRGNRDRAETGAPKALKIHASLPISVELQSFQLFRNNVRDALFPITSDECGWLSTCSANALEGRCFEGAGIVSRFDSAGLRRPQLFAIKDVLGIEGWEMGNSRFFDRPPGLTVAEIISLTGTETSDPKRLSHLIRDVAPAELAGPHDLTFIES